MKRARPAKPPKASDKKQFFQFRVSARDLERLHALARLEEVSCSIVVRRLIAAASRSAGLESHA
jgi:hypothetical protein